MSIWFDWSNTLRDRPYSLQQLGEVATAQPSALALSDRVLFDETGSDNVQKLAEAGNFFLDRYVYIHLLHTGHPKGRWGMQEGNEFRNERMEMFQDAIAFDDHGKPAVIWKVRDAESHYDHYMHVDPRKTRALDYVNLVVKYLHRYPVSGVFLDYFSARPWWYEDINSSGPHWTNDYLPAYRAYQMEFLANLREQMPDLHIIGNGRWPLDSPELFRSLDMINLEGGGGHWYDYQQVMQKVGFATFVDEEVAFVVDTRRSPKITTKEKALMGVAIRELVPGSRISTWASWS